MVRVRDLVKTYPLTKGVVFRRTVGEVRAVDGVSFDLPRGQPWASSANRDQASRPPCTDPGPDPPQSGSIEVLGTDVATLDAGARRALRPYLQVVFQDPAASLDPRLPVFDVLAEPLRANGFDKRRSRPGLPSCWTWSG